MIRGRNTAKYVLYGCHLENPKWPPCRYLHKCIHCFSDSSCFLTFRKSIGLLIFYDTEQTWLQGVSRNELYFCVVSFLCEENWEINSLNFYLKDASIISLHERNISSSHVDIATNNEGQIYVGYRCLVVLKILIHQSILGQHHLFLDPFWNNTNNMAPSQVFKDVFLSKIDLKGWDSYFEVKCSNFKSRYKWNNYLALNNMY